MDILIFVTLSCDEYVSKKDSHGKCDDWNVDWSINGMLRQLSLLFPLLHDTEHPLAEVWWNGILVEISSIISTKWNRDDSQWNSNSISVLSWLQDSNRILECNTVDCSRISCSI